ncbi:TonB-dependent receptor [Pelomonas sp. KK5]|uniref:TonB-dependent receptor n=1 Tax=Pelomonas sp. KK5 TaxID=1855730 RepID=UPI00097C0B38|nr:TonB-dependent receptor [Pelomonas sp. KK5]
MRLKSIALAATATPIACFCFGTPALAEDASVTAAAATELEHVVVTARKREERGQDVPQSLNVISGLALESSGVSTFEQLQYKLPGVAAVSGPGNQIAIRGVSNNANQRGGGPSTAVHLDGVYLPRPELALGEVFDLGRVEVLKGPEGTLYGRNATAGVVNYISRDPGQGSGFDGFVGVGTDHLVRAQAGVNLHLGDKAALRISAASTKDDGYTENLNAAGGTIDARNFQAARIKGVFQLADGVEARLTAQFVDDKGTVGYGVSGNPLTPNYANSLNPPQRQSVRRIETDTPPDVHRRGSIFSLQLTADLGGGIELKSITGVVNYDSRNRYDADGTGGFIERTGGQDKSDFWSQELQLSGGSARGLSWTTGLYFSQEKTSGGTTVEDSMSYPDDLTPFTYYTGAFNAKSRSGAVFGELSYALNEQWTLVGGARYTKEKLSGDSRGADIDFDTFQMVPFSGSGATSSGRFTPKALVQFRPSKAHMLYASVTAGFKSGGVNFNPPIKTYKPEKITAYEFGSKSVLLGGALEMDLAGFYYDYTDLQLRTVVGNQAPISNVAKATVKGVEMAFVAHPTRDLSLDLNMAYVDSALKDYLSPATGTDLSGMPLPLSPKFSGTAGAQYRVGLGRGDALTLRAEVNRQTSVIFPALQNPSLERRGPVTLVNANVRYSFADRRTWLALIGRNLGNKTYMTNRNYSAGFADVETYAAPRTVELRLGSSF